MKMKTQRGEIKLVIAGHVDHGKSTIIGRLLADTNSLPEGKLEAVKENCRRNSKPFEYAFLLDAFKDEQAQGITIDAARCFFNTKKRNYLIIDAPGHIEFLKNMITGASWAEAALMVIDASEGIQENSRRHGYMLSFLGIRQITVLVNKMDLVDYDQNLYDKISKEYKDFLAKLDISPLGFIPVSGMVGDNIASHSKRMPWYNSLTVLEQLDQFGPEKLPEDKPLRIPVQDVYKFTSNGDNRRIIAGRIESGKIAVGNEVAFCPSGKTSIVKTIESFNSEPSVTTSSAGWSVGFTTTEHIFIKRGEIAFLKKEQKPKATSLLKTRLFWLGKQPLVKDKKYLFKLGAAKVEMKLETVERVLDASTLKTKQSNEVRRNDIAECILRLDKITAFDVAEEMPETGRFVIVDDYEISGGGVVVEALADEHSRIFESTVRRNEKWESIAITEEMRAERYNQKACMILITGSPDNTLRKILAKKLTEKLFHSGRFVYFVGMANLLYGIGADIRGIGEDVRPEHIRRLAEIGNMMMHIGLILVVSAQDISENDVRILKTSLNDRGDRLITVWTGNTITTDLAPDLKFSENEIDNADEDIIKHLKRNSFIFGFGFNNSLG